VATEDERSTARQEAPLSGTRCYQLPASPERRPCSRVRERQGAPDEVEMGRLVEDAKALAARRALSSKVHPRRSFSGGLHFPARVHEEGCQHHASGARIPGSLTAPCSLVSRVVLAA
jgi:hypothetical protein